MDRHRRFPGVRPLTYGFLREPHSIIGGSGRIAISHGNVLSLKENPMTTWTWLRSKLFALAVASVLLSACGPGEVASSGGTNPPPPPPPTAGSATLTWETPTTNTDQSCLTNLTGYRIYYGTTAGSYTYQQNVNLSQITCTDTGTVTSCGPVRSCSTKITGLANGTWYFTVSANNDAGDVGSASNEATTQVMAN
jgi:hypothetical protein